MDHDFSNRCLAVIVALDAELGWGLDRETRLRYFEALSRIVPTTRTDQQVRVIVQNYHQDHERVASLINAAYPQHGPAWDKLTKDIANILRKANLLWSSDQATDRDDLVQTASAAVLEVLDTFRFESKFTTWLTTVAVRSAQRVFRDSSAKKRAVRPQSLELLDETSAPADQRFDLKVSEDLLIEKVTAILSAHPNPLVLRVFLLRYQHDYKTKEIGELVHYHPSRIRALLAEAKQLLSQSPTLRDWLEGQDDPERSENV